jgi:probable addiction module antidote protein
MKKKYPPAVPYTKGLYEDLRDPGEAARYLNAALEDGDPDVILLTMHDIAKARRMNKVADTLKVHRVSLHKMLRKNGNPSFRTFLALMGEFELQLSASRHSQSTRAA